MTIEQARQPSLEEFKRGAREQFSFLVSFGFHEVAPLVEQYQNPYEVHFEKDGWRIVIVGIAYGFSAAIDIRAPDGRSASFWHLVSDSSFRTHREEFSRGQIGDLGYEALCLNTFGQAFLRGEWVTFEELARKQAAWIAANREAERRDDLERKVERAVRKADVAFRAARYSEAAAALAEFEKFLPPAQLMKLTIARARKDA